MTLTKPLHLIEPDWPCPRNVKSIISTRRGGCSSGPYANGNFGDHVGDDPASVRINRQLLEEQTGVANWSWLQQVHGTELIEFDGSVLGQCADGVYTSIPGRACAVLTADCLPVLLCNDSGTQVAAVHAGWRGLSAGILNRAVETLRADTADLMAYLGPAIGPAHFEVGPEVCDAFAKLFHSMGKAESWRMSFTPSPRQGHYRANLYGLARGVLDCLGVRRVFGGHYCTFGDSESFYSYRRDSVTGRMVSAVWLTS